MMKKFVNHLKQAERGQSIIILAIAFVVLLGFVGLTTDVSLMFVRYATIRRAVDSASLAAATQMRQGTEEATVALAAKQFVEFHGLDSVDVLVESCLTIDRQANETDFATTEEWNQFQDLRDELCTADQRKLVKVTVQAESPTVFLRLLGWENFTLQASAISETAALDVVLIMDVSESMLSETSYDDWAKIGMGYAFVPPHADDDIVQAKLNASPPDFTGSDSSRPDNFEYWEQQLLGWQTQDLASTSGQVGVNERLWYSLDKGTGPEAPFDTLPITAPQDEYYQVDVYDLEDHGSTYDDPTEYPIDVSTIVPRDDCRVRFYPGGNLLSVDGKLGRERRAGETPAPDENQLFQPLDDFYDELGSDWSAGRWNGFVPTYDYYGCCNDPGRHAVDADDLPVYQDNGYVELDPSTNQRDWDFTDLICQPFKGARDAVELFLEKIDFIRGDRVAFVTFDRSAYLINPWNTDGQEAGRSHMIDSYEIALTTLRRVVGVRAEPTFYKWDDSDNSFGVQPNARWVALAADGTPINYERSNGNGFYMDNPANTTYDSTIRIYHNYPARNNCPFDDAALSEPYSLSNGIFGDDGNPALGIPGEGQSLPYPRNEQQDGSAMSWNSYFFSSAFRYDSTSVPDWFIPRVGYEFWSSCRGTNIGAALREGNNALVDPNTTRRFGAIWVMVLLGDGAAGASDPVRRDGDKLDVAVPYATDLDGDFDPIGGEYGAFGVCPFGTRDNPGEVVSDQAEIDENFSPTFPYCSDEQPETRHSCDFRPDDGSEAIRDNDYKTYAEMVADGDYVPNPLDERSESQIELDWNQGAGNLYDLDIGAGCGGDGVYYDVDDYARDWADYVALRDPDAPTDELLPTIYTIGFGLTYDGSEDPEPLETVEDYLGEQLLRYIADVGDNNQLDNDYYQNFADYGNNFQLELDDDAPYGVRGPCQTQGFSGDDGSGYDLNNNNALDGNELELMFEPLGATQDCGNYFNAPSADELEFVFDSIASKLFTRLAG